MTNQEVYVVTRRDRRIEPDNYEQEEDARNRANDLAAMLRLFDPGDLGTISIVKTQYPNTVT